MNSGVLAPAETIRTTVWARGAGSTGANELGLAWFGSNGNYMSNDLSSPVPPGTSNWTKLAVTAAAPVGAAYAMIYLQSTTNRGHVWFSDATVALGASTGPERGPSGIERYE